MGELTPERLAELRRSVYSHVCIAPVGRNECLMCDLREVFAHIDAQADELTRLRRALDEAERGRERVGRGEG